MPRFIRAALPKPYLRDFSSKEGPDSGTIEVNPGGIMCPPFVVRYNSVSLSLTASFMRPANQCFLLRVCMRSEAYTALCRSASLSRNAQLHDGHSLQTTCSSVPQRIVKQAAFA